jgi:AraC-like DNA-binding protein
MPFNFATLDDTRRQLPFFLATIGYDWPQENIKRPEGYPYYQWLHCLAGQGELTVGGKVLEVGPGEGFFLLPDEAHEYHGVSGDWVTDWIGFGGYAVRGMLSYVGLQASGVYELSNLWRLKTIIREVYVADREDSAIAFHDTSQLVYELLLALKIALEPRTRNAEPRHAKLRPVLQHIRGNYMRDLTIDGLAAVIGVTPQYLCQLFKQSLSMRPFEYLSAFRISRAKELLLAQPDLPVSEVARRVGFSDSNYLCRVFKRSEGLSPGGFRGLHGSPVDNNDEII